ncbi:MAG: ABC transporter substrate-binding protein [Pseudolabrys sp.]|jgi:putative ABC transport system substrate-binding protein
MKRREFITLLGGATAAWPLVARAQQAERRRIGVLMGYAESDPEAQIRLAAFKQGLLALGWDESRNLRIDLRWASGDIDRASAFARELLALHPEVILSNTTPVTTALQRETKTVPIVFTAVSDPVNAGFVASLPRPGGNVTGFINLEPTIGGKWLDLLKEIAPQVTRVAVMFNPQTAPYAEIYLRSMETAGTKFGVTPFASPVHREADIEAVIAGLGREPGSGLIAMTDSFMTVHRKAIVELAMRHKVPLMYFISIVPREGGLISYGIDLTDMFGRAASYVDRILRGAKPAELPVQLPTKFELAINLKAAKALGLTVPSPLLTSANEVIE